MRSEWVFRSLARRWFDGSSRRRGGRRPRRRSPGGDRPDGLRVEVLEDRTLLSTLPAPVSTGHLDVSLTAAPQGASENTPSVAYDPLNPQHLVAVWSASCLADTLSEIDMAFSANGGQTWAPYKGPASGSNACNPGAPITSTPIGPDIEDPENQPFIFGFAVTPSVAFDRAHTFYVSYEDVHGPSLANTTKGGAVVLKKFDFSGGAPTAITFPNGDLTQTLYEWGAQGSDPGQDPALNPRLAVDNNLPAVLPDPSNPLAPPVSFVDPNTGATQTDPYANNHINQATGLPDPNFDRVYVAWSVLDKLPASPAWGLVQVGIPTDSKPSVIRLVASSDGGNSFSAPIALNQGLQTGTRDGVNYGNPSNPLPDNDANPVLTVSQGTSSDRAGTPALHVKSLTSSGTTATVVTVEALPFWLVTGSQVTIAGADQTLYDGTYTINVNQAIPNTFTYQLAGTAPSPATGAAVTARPLVDPGGELSVAWNDYNNNQIVATRILNGGAGADFSGPLNGECGGLVVGSGICTLPPGAPAGSVVLTDYTLDLTNLVPPFGFTTISNLSVELTLFNGNLNELAVDLISPNGNDVNLMTGTDYFPAPVGVTGKNIGFVTQAPFIQDVGTNFDDSSARYFDDPNAKAPWPATYKPMADLIQVPDSLQAWDGDTLTNKAVAGKWTLQITEDKMDTTPQFLQRWELHFTSGLTANGDRIAVKNSPTNPGPVIPGAATSPYPDKSVPAMPDRGVGPSPSIAVDNTLGSFSPYQGRLYLAYTSGVSTTDPSPNIFLTTSDDGGLSWTQPVKVNDDAPTDNFSEGNRAHFEPNVAVDPVTGTVVVTWYDARYDAANARVATFIAASIDGGWRLDPSGNGMLLPDFSTNTYLNAPQQALDDARFDSTTGGHQVVTLQPIPDNQSAGNPARDTGYAFGDHQGLAVYGGHVFAVWSGNEDGGPRLTSLDASGLFVSTDNLDILSSETVLTVGPRITASTMGPVENKTVTTDDGRVINFNNTFAPEGSPTAAGGTQQVNGFVVTFDRPVDVSTLTPAEVTVLYRDTKTQANNTPPFFGGQVVDPTTYKITPLDGYVTRYGPAKVGGLTTDPVTGLPVPVLATEFLVTFAPQNGTGTYSYAIGPDVSDRIRQPDLIVVHGTPINPPPPHSTDTPIAIPPDAATGDTGGPGTPHTVSTINLSGYDPKLQITHLDVQVRINHTLDSDLVIKLIAPDGVTAAILAQNNGSGMDFGTSAPNRNGPTITSYTVFDDLATVSINLGQSPFSGSFQPETALSVFNGLGVNGAWKLDIADTSQGDVGSLIDWTMDVQAGFPVHQTGPGNKMDQNADGVTTATIVPLGAADPADVYAAPRPLGGVPFQLPYDPLTLPLSVPGPHVVSTFAPGVGAQGSPLNPPTADNLIVNGAATAIDVVFDRDMNPATFTTADLLRLVGPVGAINLFDPTTGQPLPGVYVKPDPNPQYPRLINGVLTTAADPDPAHPRTFQIGLPTDPLAPAGTLGLDLSGSYSLTLASGIQSRTGEALDTNLNAGFAVLNGADPTSTNLVAGGVSHDSGPISVLVKPGATASALINFPEGFQIQHTQVLLNITSPDARDLTGFLVSPTGAKILLFSGAGGQPRPGQLTGFINTTLDDRGVAPIQPDANGNGPAQPFTGTFSPAQPLSTLNGTSAAGQWRLEIINNSTQPSHAASITEWRLTFDENQLGTGLGEPVADQVDVHFRVFTMDPSNPLSHQVWTATGPASEYAVDPATGQKMPRSGRIGGLALDPSDPSGNTVYVAGASGGVWKTTNFLTTDPNGPTYVPLTDFGPTFGINIGALAVFSQNNDPLQTVVFAATGEGDTDSTGVGFLRSTDGGANWTLLDSTVNVDANGKPLAINDSRRDHAFVNTAAFKLLVDPVRSPAGQIVVFAALEGVHGKNTGGIWRSTDGGNTWQNVLPGQATDVTFAAYSAFDANNPAAPPGNAQVVYAGIRGQGVFVSASAGNAGTWTLMGGQQGGDPLLRSFTGNGLSAAVRQLPNGGKGRIVLASPALTGDLIPGQPYTGNRAEDLIYENWLYALVVTANDTLDGLYLTKDRGNNWTRVRLPVNITPNGDYVPTNDETRPDFDPFSIPLTGGGQGNYDASLVIDPNNPNVVYIGGTANGRPFAISRVDTTGLNDPYAVVSFDDSNKDGGLMQTSAAMTGAVVPSPPDTVAGLSFHIFSPSVYWLPYLNALRDPTNAFLNNATRITVGVQDNSAGTGFTNDGTGAIWGPFDGAGSTTDHHRVFALRDPLTGKTRLVFGDDQGVWTSIDPGNGTVLTNLGAVPGVGDPGVQLPSGAIAGDRNGNLQLLQAYYGATQPSILAAQIGQALFYANAQDDGFPVSDPNLLTNGNITWAGPAGDGTGIAADQTGTGTIYTYQVPCCGVNTGTNGQLTNFFSVDPKGAFDPREFDPITGQLLPFPSRTTGLVEKNNPGPVPDPGWPLAPVVIGSDVASSSVASNPTNADDLLISSFDGRIFRTGDQGVNWTAVAFPPGDFRGRDTAANRLDGTYAPALTFGPVDPMDPASRPDLDFLFVGTSGGHAYVTLNGGGLWTNVSTGLDGSPVVSVSANPKPGTHEFYAVTLRGVYHLTFDVTWSNTGVPGIVGSPAWTKLADGTTSNLFQLQRNAFNDPNFPEAYLLDPQGNKTPETQDGGLTALAVDWRYVIPDDPNNPKGTTHPLLYVGGEGGVFRSGDNGKDWTVFPDSLAVTQVGPDGLPGDGAPVDGGYLPLAHITDLHLAVGNVNPASGIPDQPTGPNLLYAATFGRGTFAIRLPLSSPYNTVLGPQVVSAGATNATNAPLPNPVNASVGLDTVNLVFSGTIDPSTFKIDNLQNAQVQSLTLSGTTATAVTTAPHGYTTGTRVTITGASDPAYDGTFTITVTGPSSFTYQVQGSPASPASGTITAAPVHDLQLTGPLVQSIVRTGNTAVVTMQQPDGFVVGDRIVIGGADQVAYDGSFTVTKVDDPKTFEITVTGNPTSPATGTINVLRALEVPVQTLTSSGTTATVTTAQPHGYAVGDRVVIGGADQGGYDGTFVITAVPTPTSFTYSVVPGLASPATGASIVADELPIRQLVNVSGQTSSFAVQSITRAGTIATVTTLGPNGFVSGDQVAISGATDAGYDGTFTITVLGPTTFTYTVPSSLPATASGTITATKVGGPSANNLWQVSVVHQTAYGTYTLSVGPNVTDYAGHPMDQDADDNGGGGNADDAFVKTFTIAGLQVLGVVAPSTTSPVATPPGLSSIVVNFNAPIDPASFTLGQVSVIGPGGAAVGVATIKDVSADPVIAGMLPQGVADHAWEIDLQAPQLAPGTYTVTLGNYTGGGVGISDTGDGLAHDERLMDQNENAFPGEMGVAPAGDQFQATFTIGTLHVVSVTPSLQTTGNPTAPGLSSATITFNREVAASSFDPTTQLTFVGPDGGTIGITKLTDLTLGNTNRHDTWEVDFPAQTVPGVYTLTIGTGVTDSTGARIDQDGDDPTGGVGGSDDGFTATFDISGLQVLSLSPSGPVPLPIGQGSATVTFNQKVLATTMNNNPNNVTLTGPLGNNVPLTQFKHLAVDPTHPTQDRWEIDFTPQTTYGTYTVTVGTGVEDMAGNPLNQSLNPTFNGPNSTFQGTFAIDGLQVSSITPPTTNPVLTPPGLQTMAVTFNMPIIPSTFTPSLVKLIGPDGSAIPFALAEASPPAQGDTIWQVTPLGSGNLPTPGVYTLVILPGIQDTASNLMDQNENGNHGEPFSSVTNPGDAYVARIDVAGLQVTSATPNVPQGGTPLPPGQSKVVLTFNQAVLAGTLNPNTVTLSGPAAVGNVPLVPADFVDLTLGNPNPTHDKWEVDFPVQNVPGTYTLTVGPGVDDLAGNPMNQNGNGFFGEPGPLPTGDTFQSQFVIDGLHIANISPNPNQPYLEPPALGKATLTFNREVAPNSFGTDQVTLLGPNGKIPVTLQDVTPAGATFAHSVWEVDFAPQSQAGMYTLTVGPNITDSTGTPMDQNENGVYGENPGDVFSATYDIDGLRVLSPVLPSSPLPLPVGLSSETVTFNQGVQASTFNVNSNTVSLTGPKGAVTLSAIADITPAGAAPHTVWKISFAPLSAYGTYTLTIGPGVLDLAGNPMNQNANEVYGEPGDAFQNTFAIGGLQVVASGVTPSVSQPVLTPAGLSSILLPFNMSVNSSLAGEFTLRRPDGSSVSPITVTDKTIGNTNLHNLFELDFAAQTTPGVYTLTVGPNIKDTGNHLMDQNQNGLFGQPGAAPAGDQFVAQFSVDGLAVTSVNPSGAAPQPAGLTDETVTFNQGVLPSSLSGAQLAQNVTLTGPQGPVTLLHATDITTGSPNLHNVWDLNFAPLTVPGQYTLTVGPGVDDLAGNPMNQNHNGAFGDAGTAPTGDAYQTTFVIDGLHVVSVTPALNSAVPHAPGLSSATVTFNREVNGATFDPSQVKLTAPDGTTVAVNTPVDITSQFPGSPPNSVWKVTFPTQTQAGIYSLVIGPGVQDQDPLHRAMDQNENQMYGEPGVAPAGDQFQAQFDVDGLQVLSATPATGAVLPRGQSSETVTFNQAVLASTMNNNPGNVTLTGPAGVGNVPLTFKHLPLNAANPTQDVWEVDFITAQSTYGTYTLTVGTGVEDLAGNAMNQNGNTVFGEAGDAYRTSFTINGLKVLSVTPASTVPVLASQGLSSATVTFNMGVDATTFAPGSLTLTRPDKTPVAVSAVADISGTVPGSPAGSVWQVTFPTQSTPGVYSLAVGPTNVNDLAGNPIDQNGDRTNAGYTAQFAVDGLRALAVTPSGPTPLELTNQQPAISSETVTFNQPVLAASMAVGDFTLTGPQGAVTVTNVQPLAPDPANPLQDRWEVDFAPQTVPGKYTLVVGPTIDDLAGNPMNQNLNFTFGQSGVAPTGDAFASTFTIDGLRVLPDKVVPALTNPVINPAGLSTVTLTFNRSVDLKTFDPGSDLVLKKPDGSLITGLQLTDQGTAPGGLPDTLWQVSFPAQKSPGVYTLTVGPHVSDTDPTSAEMDQDQSGQAGQPGDAYVAKFDVGGLAVLSVTPAPGSAAPAGLSAVIITFNQAVLPGSLGAGTVTLTGPGGVVPWVGFHDVTTGVPNLHNVWEGDFNPQNAYGSYTLVVGPGVQDLAGNAMDQNGGPTFWQPGVNPAGYDYTSSFRVAGLQITQAVSTSSDPAVLSAINLTFNMGVNPSTFQNNDVVLLSPGGGTIPVSVADLTGATGAHNLWQISFAPQTAQGTYMLTVVPSLLDLGNHLMDQNENGIFGEVPGDDFIQPFVIGAPSAPVGTGGVGGTTTTSGSITGLDVSGLVQIVPGRIRRMKHGHLRQTVQIFNTSNLAIQGPFFLIVDGLPRKIRLQSATNFTSAAHGPAGHPYMEVFFSANTLNSLQGGTFTLDYVSPSGRKPRSSFRLLAGIANP
jgi:subtilisin-like proprotein convertase family protein